MTPRELIKAWVEAFNKRDVERMAAFYSEDATNYQVPELPITGRDAIRAMFRDAFALADTMRGTMTAPSRISAYRNATKPCELRAIASRGHG